MAIGSKLEEKKRNNVMKRLTVISGNGLWMCLSRWIFSFHIVILPKRT